MSYEMLFSPMKIGTMTVKNRIVMTAAEFSMASTDGRPTETLMDYYEERAKGGVGLIIPGICRVNDMAGASTFTQLAMSHNYHIKPMREFAERIHRHGAKLAIQLHHAGRQGMASSINSLPLVIPAVKAFPPVLNGLFKCTPLLLGMEAKGICFSVQAPSEGEFAKHGATRMHAMSRHEVKALIRDFIEAAVRCKKAGVDAVELHAGHGYLIQQFLSPNTNHRTDEFGGSFEKRLRFLTEIVVGIKARCGRDYPLMVRLTADEMYDRVGMPGKGYDLETGKKIAKRLEALGVDAINVTSACYDAYNYWLEPTSFEPGWRKYLAGEIKKTVKIPVVAANVIRTPEQAERQLQEGCQDFVASARTFICDPHWAIKAQTGHPEEIRRCIGCLNCIRSFMNNAGVGKPGECALNMSVADERKYFNLPDEGKGRKVIVLGAGPAGLTAAETLARRGFDVTVYEKAEKPGGQVITAAACHLKEKLFWCIEDLCVNAKKAGAKILLGKTLTAKEIAAEGVFAVIVATGGVPLKPRSIEGIGGANVLTAGELILKKKEIRDSRVAVIGSGMTGLAVTELLEAAGNQVQVIEMAGEIAPGAWFQLVDDEMSRISDKAVFRTGTKLVKINPDSIVTENVQDGTGELLPVDYVVLAMGVRPDNVIAKELTEQGVWNVYCVGDADRSGTIADACHTAYQTAMQL